MKKLLSISKQFRDEESGAAMVEYTILLGLIAAATIATILLVSGWVQGVWSGLCSTLNDAAVGSATCATGA